MEKWDIVLVIITLFGLVGIIVGWIEKLTKPLNDLNSTNSRLAGCVASLEKQLDKLILQNEKEHMEIWDTVNEHSKDLHEQDKRITVIETKETTQ